jgi:DNA-binding transcriptional ArsR family regulator
VHRPECSSGYKGSLFRQDREAHLAALRNRSIFCFTSSRFEKSLAISYTLWCNVGVDQLSDVLTAISHPTRRAIIRQLANGPARFLDVAEPYDLALNAVTKHLKLLERAGLIDRKKQGREVLISFRAEPLQQVAGWVHEYERFWNERLDQFEQHFREKKKKEK